MTEPIWLTIAIVDAIHDEQLTWHGGGAGTRDRGALLSALQRPRDKWHYDSADLPALAAAYAYGIARNHPYVDGNKRTAFLALYTFLGLNSIDFIVPEPAAASIIPALAAGEVDEESLTRWIRDNWPKSL
jgi:death on curing protein